MVVWTMEVDELVSKFLQHREGGGRAVNELPIRSAGGKRSLDNHFAIRRLNSRFGEAVVKPSRAVAAKDRFHHAAIRARSDQRFVGTLTEEKLQCSDNNRLAGACFAGHCNKSRC